MIPNAVYARLSQQHGAAGVADMLQLGATRSQIEWMVRSGELIRVHLGVYRHAAAPVTRDLRLQAGLLAIGPGAVLSHRAAIARHGVRGFDCDLVEISHGGTTRLDRPGVVVHRSRTLHLDHGRRIGGLPTTSPARSLVDAAGVLPAALVARWAQDWLADRKLTFDQLAAAIEAAGRHLGARRLLAELDGVVADADSRDEALLGTILRHAGFPPELHTIVTTGRGHTYELDWSYPDARLGLELDGYGVHLRSIDVFENDRFRRNELTLDGWTILNFTSRQCRRNPARVVDQVSRALRVGSC